MPIHFDHPALLWLLLLAGPIVWLGWRSLAALDPVRRWTAVALRVAVLVVLVLILAGLQAVRQHSDLTVVAMIDQSESVHRFAHPPTPAPDAPADQVTIEQWVRDWIARSAGTHRRDDRLGAVVFDGRPSVIRLPAPGVDLEQAAAQQAMGGTDIASAIRLAMALFPADSGKRLLLASDGNDTVSGDLLAAAREARAAGVAIDVLPIEYKVDNEVMVEGVYAPTEARTGQTVAVRVVLAASHPTAGLLHMKHDGLPIDLTPAAPGSGAPVTQADWTAQTSDTGQQRYLCVRLVELPMAFSGANRFEAIFEPAKGQDAITANNRAEGFTLVHGKGRLLFVDNVGGDSGAILPNALRQRGIDLDVIPPVAFPTDLVSLQRYDAVIFQNVPAEAIVPAQQRLLATYVNDLGGGFVMLGGPDSFGAGGWTHSTVDRILPVECEIPSQTVLPSGALVLVLDRSGSMAQSVSGSPWSQQEIANQAAVLAVSTLYPQDMVGVVAFDDSAKWIVPLTVNSDPSAVVNRIQSIHPGGGTNIYSGLEQAYQALRALGPQDAAVKHVILLTDGQSQGASYFKIVGQMVQAGITLSTVGVGDGVNNSLLNQLGQMGGGTYYPVSDPKNLPQIFIKEARTIRKNLIREIDFTPAMRQTGSPIMAGLRATPQLKGLVLTGPKRDPRVFLPMLGPEGEPLFAHWQVGLGRTAAFTSDATNRWAVDWLGWSGYGDFWARTARTIARPAAGRGFDLVSSIQNDTLRLRLDASSNAAADDAGNGGGSPGGDSGGNSARNSGGDAFVNFLNVVGTVVKPDGSTAQVKLQQTGPGVYEAALPARQAGSYLVSLFAANPSGSRQAVFGGASRPPGAELRQFRSNRAVLQEVASLTGGRVFDPRQPDPAAVFNRDGVIASRSLRPLWRTLLAWLLALFLLDVASRRIAWDAGAMWRWTRQRVAVAGNLLKSRDVDAAATLGALKRRAAEVDRRLAEGRVDTDAPIAPAPPATAKFEADLGAEAAADFAAAVGAAKVSEPRRAAAGAAGDDGDVPRGDGDDEATTSRLLDAKRRARQRLVESESDD